MKEGKGARYSPPSYIHWLCTHHLLENDHKASKRSGGPRAISAVKGELEMQLINKAYK